MCSLVVLVLLYYYIVVLLTTATTRGVVVLCSSVVVANAFGVWCHACVAGGVWWGEGGGLEHIINTANGGKHVQYDMRNA